MAAVVGRSYGRRVRGDGTPAGTPGTKGTHDILATIQIPNAGPRDQPDLNSSTATCPLRTAGCRRVGIAASASASERGPPEAHTHR